MSVTAQTIFIVEDDPAASHLVTALLRDNGYAPYTVASAEAAFETLAGAEAPPQLILLDSSLPGIDGLEACRRFRADERLRQVPIVMLAVPDDLADRFMAFELGASDFVTKPYEPAELLARIGVLLRARTAEQQIEGRNRMLAALNRLALAMSEELTIDHVLEIAVTQALESLALESARMFLLDERGAARLAASAGEAGTEPALEASGPVAEAVEAGWPVFVAQCDDGAQQSAAEPAGMMVKAAVPIRADERTLGVLEVDFGGPRQLASPELELLTTLGSYVGLALKNARLIETVRRRAASLSVLNEIGQAVASTLDLAEVFDHVHAQFGRLVDAQHYCIALHRTELNELSFPLAVEHGTRVERRSRPFGNGLLEHVLRRRHSLLLRETLEAEAEKLGLEVLDPVPRTWLGAPVQHRDEVFGALALWDLETERAFDHEHEELVGILASQIAVAIANARLLEQTQRVAMRDPLTGLYNLRYFKDRLVTEMKRARRAGTPVSLILCDLDRYKRVNDKYGHQCGDYVLGEIGRILNENVRESDIKCRYGGDEFVLLLPETEQEAAARVADQLREKVDAAALRWHGYTLRITASFGVAGYRRKPDMTPDALLRLADEALYQAKHTGRNRVESAGVDSKASTPSRRTPLV